MHIFEVRFCNLQEMLKADNPTLGTESFQLLKNFTNEDEDEDENF
jgi:hypothetical protein